MDLSPSIIAACIERAALHACPDFPRVMLAEIVDGVLMNGETVAQAFERVHRRYGGLN